MLDGKQKSPEYTRRRPELTPCYKIVQNHVSTFITDREREGRPLPEYVIEEFEAFLRCGIAAFGFIRLKCLCCGEEMIAALICNAYCTSFARRVSLKPAYINNDHSRRIESLLSALHRANYRPHDDSLYIHCRFLR